MTCDSYDMTDPSAFFAETKKPEAINLATTHSFAKAPVKGPAVNRTLDKAESFSCISRVCVLSL